MGKALVLNSRQNLYPLGQAPWVISSKEALCEAGRKGYIILSSVGMSSWEVPLYWAIRLGVRQIVYIPGEPVFGENSPVEYYCRQFQHDPGLIEWRLIGREVGDEKSHWFPGKRDSLMIADADIIYPVSIRSGGNLDRLINEAKIRGTEIDNRFQVEYRPDRTPQKLTVSSDLLDPEIDNRLKNHIIHWTRSFHGPWPGETCLAYYDAVMAGGEPNPRSALHTLQRIFREKRLRASAGHYRRKFPAVSFSALVPSQAAALMKWRARYRQMTFEPYGVAMDISSAETYGVRKVIYGEPGDFVSLALEDKPYFQTHGRKGNWDPEKEWRHIGELDLSHIRQECLKAVVWKKEEISRIKSVFGGEVISLCS